jgi:hypothetical protein
MGWYGKPRVLPGFKGPLRSIVGHMPGVPPVKCNGLTDRYVIEQSRVETALLDVTFNTGTLVASCYCIL